MSAFRTVLALSKYSMNVKIITFITILNKYVCESWRICLAEVESWR